MSSDVRWLVGFVCFLLAVCIGLGAALIWQNATKPAMMIESCIAAEIKRGAP